MSTKVSVLVMSLERDRYPHASLPSIGYLSESHEVFEVPLLVQVYDYIRSSKETGVSEPDIGRHFGMSRLVRRSVVKEMKRCSKIERFVTNEGRQKTGR